ncbi:MAG: hypothetical protein AB7V40_01820 [Methyloceanibacter sp.]
MVVYSGLIVIAGGAVSYSVARRLTGEAQIFGGYFAGFVTGGLIAFLIASTDEIQDEAQRRAALTILKEVVGLAPVFGVALAKAMRRRSQRLGETAAEAAPRARARHPARLNS